jgi:hypothetical protein
MNPQGYWQKPGAGYSQRYRGTVWSVILLAQLGASCDVDPRLGAACSYILDHTCTEEGQFAFNGVPSGTVDCLQGNLCAALLDLGCRARRLDRALGWMARSVTGEGVAPVEDKTAARRYYTYKCGPNFACGANKKLPCAWGAVKVMLAFGKLPDEKRTRLVDRAIARGIRFLFSTDPAKADYPSGNTPRPSKNWWKFGFPVFYVTDLLQNLEALVALGYGKDPRLSRALELVREKGGLEGRWPLEYDYAGKTWGDYGETGQPNKWVTLRALRVLDAAKAA